MSLILDNMLNTLRAAFDEKDGVLVAPTKDSGMLADASPNLYTHADRHLAVRRYEGEDAPRHTAAFLALARYEQLLERGFAELAGKLRASDVEILLECLAGDVYDASDHGSLASLVMFDYGWQSVEEVPEQFRRLIDVLCALNPIEHAALADALEQISHVVLPKDPRCGLAVAARRIGLRLNPET